MKRINPKLSLAIVLIIFLLLFGFASGYRLDGLSAARANAFVPKDSVLLDAVEYDWGGVYIFDSIEKPVTAISIKSHGFLWSSRSSVYYYHHNDPIKTIGGASLSHGREETTVISILVDDPKVSYLEVGPTGNRVKKEASSRNPMTFAWNESVQFDRLYPKAFDKDGKLLYEYRYLQTNFTRSEDLRWYPTTQE